MAAAKEELQRKPAPADIHTSTADIWYSPPFMSAFAGGTPPEVTGVAHSGGYPSVQLAAPGVIPICEGTGIGFVFELSPFPHGKRVATGAE